LLLLSASAAHPNGLANSSGLVGKRLMHHPMGLVTGVFDTRFENWKGPFAVALFCQEFYETDRSRGFVRGFQLQLLRSAGGPLGTALGGYLPRVPWGEAHHRVFAQQFGRTASFCVTTEDLPDVRNEVALDRTLTDAHGLPAPRVRYRIDANTHAMLEYGAARAREALREAGAHEVMEQHVVRGCGFHLMGTARMGEDPRASVVDRHGRAHDVRNLWIADASVFVTAAAVNPTSTLMALALRAGDDIAAHRDELGTAP
jgi:choline dehydrogenase-like flavoprotein